MIELTNRYPLYSHADQANWMLGQIYEKTEHNEIAARYYSRIVKDYPLSSLSGDAKNKLVKFGVPVPPSDPTAVARMQIEQSADRPGIVKRTMTVLKTGPDVSAAARSGAPTMTPASESGDETIGFSLQPNTNGASTSSIGSTATVETVTPGSPNSLPPPTASTPATDPAPAAADPATGATGSSSDSNTTAPTSTTTPAPPANTSQESTSKKKGGLRKLIPF